MCDLTTGGCVKKSVIVTTLHASNVRLCSIICHYDLCMSAMCDRTTRSCVQRSVTLISSQGPFKSLEIDFSIKGLFRSFDSAHGSFLFIRRSFPLWVPLKSIFVSNVSKLERRATVFCEWAVVFFAVVPQIMMWLLEAYNTPTMLQSREIIALLFVNVCPQSSVDTDTIHKDRIASSFLL